MFLDSDSSESKWNKCDQHELWKAFQEDSRSAFSVFFLRFYERLFRYGMNFSSSEAVVKDSIQTLFLRLWKRRKMLNCPESIEAYLYVSLRRILLRSNKRKNAREDRHLLYVEDEYEEMFSVEELIIFQEERTQRKILFQKALQTLSLRHKEALLLRIDSGMSNLEIAGIMDVSEKRVRNLIYEATRQLKSEIHRLTDWAEK